MPTPPRTKGPCRTCQFSELLPEGMLECREGPPTVVAVRIVEDPQTKKPTIVDNLGVNWMQSRMRLDYDGCWRWQKSKTKKMLPE